jgi:hypothetical protein
MSSDVAIYALTRGYAGLQKIRYGFIIRRNRALRKVVPKDLKVDYLLFHEGNIHKIEQFLIQFLSGLKIDFCDVSSVFKPDENQHYNSMSQRDLGYALMCRFHYRDVWRFLAGYDVVYRVDEDCVVEKFPVMKANEFFVTGFVTEETHEDTNATLPQFLETLGLARYYDHEFPYTNFFISRTALWTKPDVQKVLHAIGNHHNALLWRWGDLPVLGTVLKAFYDWNPASDSHYNVSYKHLSHNACVRNGQTENMQRSQLIEISRFIRKML